MDKRLITLFNVITFAIFLSFPVFAQDMTNENQIETQATDSQIPDTTPVDVPPVNDVISEEIRQEIQALKELSPSNAINQLKNDNLVTTDNILNQTITETFSGREIEAIQQAINVLRRPRIEVTDGKTIDKSSDFHIAKKILENFSDQAVSLLKTEYDNANASLKVNLLQVLGSLNSAEVNEILTEALNDKGISDDLPPEMEGEPLRVCDMAYNQLIWRLEIPDLLRTIGPIHKLEVRDYHIEILKEKLNSAQPIL